MMKIMLGTAQFGFKYGVSNKVGQIAFGESKNIIELATVSNIDYIDTAIAYGDSEKILGEIGVSRFNVVTKLPALPENISEIDAWVEGQVNQSFSKLKLSSVYAILLHNPYDLMGEHGAGLAKALMRLKTMGLVKKVGVSIYDPAVLNSVFKVLDIDIIQAPLNLIDRRLETSGWIDRLYQLGIEIHVRSVFLQGLLQMERSDIPLKFDRWSDKFDSWHKVIKDRGLSTTEACLSYPLSLPQVKRVVVGVENCQQLINIVNTKANDIKIGDFDFMQSDDQDLINPGNWSKF